MSCKGSNSSCVGYCDLIHFVLKGDLVTWRVDSSGTAVELGSINVKTAVGQLPSAIVAHPDKLLLFVAGSTAKDTDPGFIYVFHLASGRCVETLGGHTRKVTHLVWVPGQGLVSGSTDGSCRLWGDRGSSRVVYETGRTKTFLGDTEPEKIEALAVCASDLLIGNQGGGIELLKLGLGAKVSENVLPLWKERKLKDIPKSALEKDEKNKQRIKDRIERKKREGTLGDTSSDEDKRKKEEEKQSKAKFDIKDKEPLARRTGDHDNGISCLLSGSDGVVYATTTAGEVLRADRGKHSSLVVFRKSYGGSLALGTSQGQPRLFTANRGYDADKYEVVILSVDPFEQLARVTPNSNNNMIINLVWSPSAKKVLIEYDLPTAEGEPFLFALDPDGQQTPTVVLAAGKEHLDTMDQEYAVSIIEHIGIIYCKTNWGRIRRMSVQNSVLKELDALGESSSRARKEMCVHRETGTAYSVRNGYDNFKFDIAIPDEQNDGNSQWVRLCDYEWPISRGMKSLEDNPVGHMAYLEYPLARDAELRCMVVIMGELGGLFCLVECSGASPKFSNYEGAKIGDCSFGFMEACVSWDAEGALIAARNGRGMVTVFLWSPQKLHGELKGAKLSSMTRIEGSKALVAARDLSSKTPMLAIYDIRALSLLQSFSLDERGAPRCLHCSQASLFAYCAIDYVEGSSTRVKDEGVLVAWPAALLVKERDGSSPEAPTSIASPLYETSVKSISSMVVIPDVGLITAHTNITHGISVWCHITGRHLVQLYPPGGGTSIRVSLGPGDRCILWNILNGPAGYFRWSALGVLHTTSFREGVPIFSMTKHLMLFIEFAALLASFAQFASFAMRDEDEENLEEITNLRRPEFLRLPAMEHLSELSVKLQDIPIPSVVFFYKYVACITFVVLFSVMFVAQEVIEMKAYLYPKSCWGSMMYLANQVAKVSVQSLALPVLSHLIAGIVCKGGVMSGMPEVECLKQEHFLYAGPAIFAAVILQALCLRLAYAGYNLSNIDASLNLFNAYYDLQPERETPSHLIEPVSRTYQTTGIISKTALKCLKVATPFLRRLSRTIPLHSGMKFVTFGFISYSSATSNPFVMRPYTCWIQPCSIIFATDTANFFMYLCILLNEVTANTALPAGSWLDALSWMVIPVIFISILARTNLDMSKVTFCGPCRRRWRHGDGYVELPEYERSTA